MFLLCFSINSSFAVCFKVVELMIKSPKAFMFQILVYFILELQFNFQKFLCFV